MTKPQQLPQQAPRIETGPLKFGDDWQGVFIRGDSAMWWGMQLGELLERMDPKDSRDRLLLGSLNRLRDVLSSAREV